MIKACIFDLDGTLAYTLDSMAVVGNEVVRKYGLKPMPIENYRYYCGNGADMLVKDFWSMQEIRNCCTMRKQERYIEKNLIKTHFTKYSIIRECRKP